ncbi:MAG: MerR family transcriptional regulator, partial [Lachnospiraceae bacterium]|nr:MerR family transcriptional regulator [Lachnospiraceae bacterium]
MTQEVYTIGDAAKQVHVETHVLRYWEEELGLSIQRNVQGHRFYTKEDVELLDKIKSWKDQGMQLKAIRIMLSEDGKLAVPQEIIRQAQAMMENEKEVQEKTEENALVKSASSVENILLDERSSKAAKLQFLLENLVSRAVQESSAAVLKEIDYQFRQLEENAQAREQRQKEREEEHYRKLDEL